MRIAAVPEKNGCSKEQVKAVEFDLTHSHIWDLSAVAAVDRGVLKFRDRDVGVTLVGLNEASATLLGRIGVHDKPRASLSSGH